MPDPARPACARLLAIAQRLAVAGAMVALAARPAGAAFGQSGTLSALTFLTANLGWIRVSRSWGGEGALYRTDDGGRRWIRVRRFVSASILAFRSRLDGEALVPVPGSAGMCHLEVTAVDTVDGGRTWHHPSTIRVEDAPIALAFADRTPFALDASCAGPAPALWAPTSSGRWKIVASLPLSNRQSRVYLGAGAIALTPNGSLAAVAYSALDRARTPLIRLYAREGGRGLSSRAWRAVRIGVRDLPGWILAVSFLDPSDGIVAARARNQRHASLWVTHDGGRRWIRARRLSAGDPISLDLVTSKVAYAGLTTFNGPFATSALYKSTDGGRTWQHLLLP